MLGRKAKCTKCGKSFRVPAALPAPGAPPVPAEPVPEAESAEVMMAEAVDPVEAVPPPANLPAAVPVPAVAALPSADPFDFSQPAPAKPAKPARSKDQAPPAPVPAPKPVAAPEPVPAKAAAPPAVSPEAPAPAAKPKPAPEPLSLGDDPPIGAPSPRAAAVAKSAPAEEGAADDPFAFSGPPAKGEKVEKPTKVKRRYTEDAPAKAKSGDEATPRKKDATDGKPDQPAPSKKSKPAPQGTSADGYNPFTDFDSPDEAAGDAPEPGKPARAYRGASKSGGLFKAVLITGVIGVCAAGLAVAATVAYVKNLRKEAEQLRKEAEELAKKNEKKDDEPTYVAPPGAPPGRDRLPDPKAPPEPAPKEPEPKAPVSGPGSGRPALVLPAKLKSFTVGALPPKLAPADKPRVSTELDAALPAVKRVFPPFDPTTADTCVLLQTRPAADGKGERLALDTYGPAGNRVADARIEYDGDGSVAPIADLSASATGVFFLYATAGKLTVWNVVEKKKLAEAVEPYADRPDHARAGLAAAYFAADPGQVVTVSTAGAVLLYDLAARKAVAEFVPPNGVPGKVALGQSVAVADGHGSVALAVAGVLYQVRSAPELPVLRKYDLEGDVSRSFGLAVSGTPGRVLYAFEVDKAGKKEKAVLGVAVEEAAKHVIYRWPDGLGDPKGTFWANGTGAGVATDRGVLWFDDDEGKFLPLVLTQPATTGLYAGDERYFWYLIPHPTVPTRSALRALPLPFNDATEYRKAFPANQPLRATRISATGLEK
ncbi:hypothetical protein FTUN_4634 [Frigoriglobus tundricola]|uniref:Uncharacterized protein n=2 Tax=Frigoriglobus tundricola TaxID=2774151 RepID=A0A6M5YUK7_9BACT|nr:hypothetical protein FTUN_4634 [Frigoriglobus tundricola]